MTLIGLLVIIAIVGVIVYLMTHFLDMPEKFKQLLNTVAIIVVIAVVVLWLLSAFGGLSTPIITGRIA